MQTLKECYWTIVFRCTLRPAMTISKLFKLVLDISFLFHIFMWDAEICLYWYRLFYCLIQKIIRILMNQTNTEAHNSHKSMECAKFSFKNSVKQLRLTFSHFKPLLLKHWGSFVWPCTLVLNAIHTFGGIQKCSALARNIHRRPSCINFFCVSLYTEYFYDIP